MLLWMFAVGGTHFEKFSENNVGQQNSACVNDVACYSTLMIMRRSLRRISIKVQLRMIFMDVCCGPPSPRY
jgi:hypothetical protein